MMQTEFLYPVKLHKQQDESYNVIFNDFENIITCGESIVDALFNAKEALACHIGSMIKDKKTVPPASLPSKDDYIVPLTPSISFPLFLVNYRKQNKLSQTSAAKICGVSQQQWAKYENPDIAQKLDTVDTILSNLGFDTTISIKKI
jgi:antitoxin HicB